jgi:hypothetical protein
MAQVTILYQHNDLESKIKEIATSQEISISKYISIIIEKINNNWSPKIKNLAGSWNDFTSIEEVRNNLLIS